MKNNKRYLTYSDVNIYPGYSTVRSRSDVDLKSKLTKKTSIDLPVVSAPMDTVTGSSMAIEMVRHGAIGALHRDCTITQNVEMLKDIFPDRVHSQDKHHEDREDWNVIATIGATGDYLDRADALISNGATIILIDVAHGHHTHVHKALTEIKMKYPEIEVIAGNIATPEAAVQLAAWGADALRVGVGGGSVCSTRLKTGVGVPMITCVQDIVQALEQNDHDIPVIADGGIKTAGDMAKALAAGADTVMCGGLFSGTKETPGSLHREGFFPNERLYKRYRGAASESAKIDNRGEAKNVEGVSRTVEYKGPVSRLLNTIKEDLQSAYSYVGAKTTTEFHSNADLIEVSNAGHVEGTPHF